MEYSNEYKERLLTILEAEANGNSISDADAIILFHWVRHKNDPEYSFVPDKYRRK